MSLFRSWRRKRILAKPFPEAWRDILRRNLSWYHVLSPAEKGKLERDLSIFIAEKNWEGCAGQVINDEVMVTIAGQAAVLVLGWDDYLFERVKTILVYPASYRTPGGTRTSIEEDELVTVRLGEALHGGPIVLSWRDTLTGTRVARDGQNVVLHEFAHVLDMENGMIDGVPLLPSQHAEEAWSKLIHHELEDLRRQLDLRRQTLLNPYAATNVAEFFAVATESFFEEAPLFKEIKPELYRAFSEFYRQNPVERFDIHPHLHQHHPHLH